MEFKLKGNYFEGKFQTKQDDISYDFDEVIEKYSPANLNHQLWHCSVDYSETSKILDSAVTAQKTWRNTTIKERMNFLSRYQEAVQSRSEELTKAIALETGKPLWESATETLGVINKVNVTIEESRKRIEEKNYSNIAPGTDGKVYYRPIGPCLIIGPFNFPVHLANGQILSALLAGNTIIFKPSEKTIYSAQILIECFHQANFPKGVVNLVNGSGEVVKRLIKEKAIKGIFFTGSKEVGLKIMQSSYQDFSKLVALELGGKNTSIIHKDASFDYAIKEMLQASFLTAGQRCSSTSIIAIHEDICEKFISQFHKLSKRIIIDHPIEHDHEPFMGPLIDDNAQEKYLLYMGMAIREGAKEVMRGKSIEKKYRGHYVSPSIHYFDKPDFSGHFLRSEIFGPNVTFLPYREIEEAINFANESEYGLVGSVFSSDKAIYQKCCHEIDVGLLNFNRSTVGANSKLPFGGVKNSGNYRPAAVSMIDSCVYPLAGLEVKEFDENVSFDKMRGLS